MELLQEVKRSSGHKFDSTFTNVQVPNIESKLDVTYDNLNLVEPTDDDQVLDATYIQMPSNQPETHKFKQPLDVTFDSNKTSSKLSNATATRRIRDANENFFSFVVTYIVRIV